MASGEDRWGGVPSSPLSLDTHASRHENGGADEISIEGLSGLAADDQHVLDAEVVAVAVARALFDANTILKADSDNTPAALTVAEQTLVGRITSGSIAALTVAQVITLLGGTSRTFLCNNFIYSDTADWHPHPAGAHLHSSKTGVTCWIPLSFLKVGDIITSYNFVGDAIISGTSTLDCKLVRVNKADPITTTDLTNGAITQITADGNFDQIVNVDDETVATDKQYYLEITGTTDVSDEFEVMGVEVAVTRLI